MTNIKSIARPYAKAAFEAANAAHQLPLWTTALKQLSIAAQDKKMKEILKDPRYTQKQMSELLLSVLHEPHQEIKNFIDVLAEHQRLEILPEISRLFEADIAKASGSISLSVTCAFPMNDAQKKETEINLSKQFNATCDIDFRVDEKMIGGMIVRSGNWVMDGSVTGKLERLKSILS